MCCCSCVGVHEQEEEGAEDAAEDAAEDGVAEPPVAAEDIPLYPMGNGSPYKHVHTWAHQCDTLQLHIICTR